MKRTWHCLIAALALTTPGAAQAGLEICNDTSAKQTVAIGYKSNGNWVSEGWWNIAPGSCSAPVKDDLVNRYYYYRAEAEGRSFQDDNIAFCTTSQAFTITGDQECVARGYKKSLFRKIDTGPDARHFTLTLIDTSGAAPGNNGPGTFGEPYANVAIHQECLSADGEAFCAFHADGAKFFVYDDGRTSPAVLSRLRALDPGTPIVVSGDLVAVYDATAEVVLHEVAARSPTALDDLLRQMQGGWYSQDDPNSQITVLGAERVDTYDGQEMGSAYLRVQDRCNDYQNAGPYLIAREPETGTTDCYVIDYIDAREMTLMYLPRGNFLTYRRLD